MINLLPTTLKTNVMYARRNTRLVRTIVVLLIVIFGLSAVIMGGTVFLKRSIDDYTSQVNQAREQLKIQKLEETQARLDALSNNVKLVVQVLSREILFSKLLRQLGAAIPANTALESLQIDKVSGALTLRAKATSITTATQLQLNLQDPANGIFEKAEIENISCQATDTRYRCSVQIKALFVKNNPFLFLNQNAPKTQGRSTTP